MKNLDDFIGEDKRKPLGFSCQCTACSGNNTKVFVKKIAGRAVVFTEPLVSYNIVGSWVCRSSSMVEQGFCKAEAGGSNPLSGSRCNYAYFEPGKFFGKNSRGSKDDRATL